MTPPWQQRVWERIELERVGQLRLLLDLDRVDQLERTRRRRRWISAAAVLVLGAAATALHCRG